VLPVAAGQRCCLELCGETLERAESLRRADSPGVIVVGHATHTGARASMGEHRDAVVLVSR
jgi:hypothetical protein